MMRTWWRRLGPWLTPVLVVVEVVLVWSGLLSLLDAVIIAVVVEVSLAVTVVGRGVVAVRRYRSGRADGRNGWLAAQDGLAQLMPRQAARVLLGEVRIWACLLLWVRRRGTGSPDAYPYSRSLRPILLIVLVLLVVEGAVVEMGIALILGHSVWVWVAFGLHLCAMIWIAGILAALDVLPYLVRNEFLQLRDSVFNLITIPYPAIAEARIHRQANLGRSRFKVDRTKASAVLAYGDATVQLMLRSHSPVSLNGEPYPIELATLAITADDP